MPGDSDNTGSLTWGGRRVVTAANNTEIGSINKPVYISNTGLATAISYTIDKSVPSNAVFTDTLVTQNVKTDNKKYGIILSNYETSASTTTAAAVNRDSKVYVNPSLNSINAGQITIHNKAATPIEKAYMIWNDTDQSIDFVFI